MERRPCPKMSLTNDIIGDESERCISICQWCIGWMEIRMLKIDEMINRRGAEENVFGWSLETMVVNPPVTALDSTNFLEPYGSSDGRDAAYPQLD